MRLLDPCVLLKCATVNEGDLSKVTAFDIVIEEASGSTAIVSKTLEKGESDQGVFQASPSVGEIFDRSVPSKVVDRSVILANCMVVVVVAMGPEDAAE